MYYIYMLRCEDNSIYTGITTDINKRMNEHFTRSEKCAKYTMTHHAKKLERYFACENRKSASKLEYHIKRLKKADKEALIREPERLGEIVGDKVNEGDYNVIR